jgi:hypothetical protein
METPSPSQLMMQTHIYGLMAVAEEHQKAVAAAIEGLAAERKAVALERKALSQEGVGFKQAAIETLGSFKKVVSDAASSRVTQSLQGTADAVVAAFSVSSRPFLQEMKAVTTEANDAQHRLREATSWFSWRCLALLAVTAAGVIIVMWFIAIASVEWQRHRINALIEERSQLAAEIEQLQAQANDWAKRGGRAKLDTCGDQKRLCVRVDRETAYGKNADYFVLRGY